MAEEICDCLPPCDTHGQEHWKSEHANDCTRNTFQSWDGSRCGGCTQCISDQLWYYYRRDLDNALEVE
jgi:hypothetical protein